jgi:tRNA U34 5-methylaminomethyl-2-thiouridine-forming methyltransferase MnmC
MVEIIQCEDGTQTVYSPIFQETYHSIKGAIQESHHVFIRAGLNHLIEKGYQSIKILEFGFGTGLNALLVLDLAQDLPDISIEYVGIEKYPLDNSKISNLAYHEKVNVNVSDWLKLHSGNWHIGNFKGKVFHRDFNDFESDTKFDLVFHDAFSPNIQEEYWRSPFLQKVYEKMNKGGVLVTYCAQGEFRRELKRIGFTTESLPGPLGKREMTRATKL